MARSMQTLAQPDLPNTKSTELMGVHACKYVLPWSNVFKSHIPQLCFGPQHLIHHRCKVMLAAAPAA